MLTEGNASLGGLYFFKPRRWGFIVCTENRSNMVCQCMLTSSTSDNPTRSHSRGSWEGIKPRNYAWDWLLASAPWRWLSRVNVRTLHRLSHWQNISLNVCRFHTALGRHNDAQAKFARLHNCPLIVSQKKALITKRYKELPGRRIMFNLVGRIWKRESTIYFFFG